MYSCRTLVHICVYNLKCTRQRRWTFRRRRMHVHVLIYKHTHTANWLLVHKWVCIFRRFGKLGTHTHAHAYAKHTNTHALSRNSHTHAQRQHRRRTGRGKFKFKFICMSFFILSSTFSGLAALSVPRPSPISAAPLSWPEQQLCLS